MASPLRVADAVCPPASVAVTVTDSGKVTSPVEPPSGAADGSSGPIDADHPPPDGAIPPPPDALPLDHVNVTEATPDGSLTGTDTVTTVGYDEV